MSYFFSSGKVVKLVGEGFVFNGATLSSLELFHNILLFGLGRAVKTPEEERHIFIDLIN